MPHDWRSATLLQARSDYEMLRRLQLDIDAPYCHTLHYLQMTTEKLAKAYLTPPGGKRYAKTHKAFVKFVRAVNVNLSYQQSFGFRNADQFRNYVAQLESIAQEVEDLSRDGGDHPNPEYPWDENGAIIVPVEYPFANLSRGNADMVRLLKFIDTCFPLAQ